jgi:hypothetical protein
MMETSPKSARIFRWSRRYVILCSAVVAMTIGVANWFFDSLMALYFPHIGVKVMSVTFSGISAGIIFKLLVTAAWERKVVVEERLRLIAEMNHHIRNGLDIISLSAHTTKDKNTVETMKYGVEKIEWALREVLPKLPQSGSL